MLPNPVEAQMYRIQDLEGRYQVDTREAMVKCDEKGPLVICVNKVIVDPTQVLL